MRPFEILLIAVNVLTLLLSFRKQTKTVWLAIAGVNLFVFLLHGSLEGFRYQMNLSYVFVVLLVVCVAAMASGKFTNIQIPRVVRGVAKTFCFVLIALSAVLSYILPVFTFPEPTGKYVVGVHYFALLDEHRTDPFLSKSTRKRELMVKVYYPAKPDDRKPFTPYFHGSTKLLRAFAGFYQMPRFVFDHFALVKTHAKDDLELSDKGPIYPVILFSHGAGTNMEVATSQSEDLASHGYVVADVDHTYVSSATVFPDRIVTAQEATTNFDTPEPAEPITQIMADDDAFVLQELSEMNAGSLASPFKGKLNLQAVGVIGHSVGGATAYNLAINDRRVKAAINLDGVVYVTPRNPRAMAPFLMLANDKYHVQAIEKRESLMQKLDTSPAGQQEMLNMYGSREKYQAVYNKAQRNVQGLADVLAASGNFYTIEGSDHMKFTDIGLFIGSQRLRELLQIGGKTDPARCLTITQALTVAFFDQHLKGQTTDTLTPLLKTYPELRKVRLKEGNQSRQEKTNAVGSSTT